MPYSGVFADRRRKCSRQKPMTCPDRVFQKPGKRHLQHHFTIDCETIPKPTAIVQPIQPLGRIGYIAGASIHEVPDGTGVASEIVTCIQPAQREEIKKFRSLINREYVKTMLVCQL